MRQRPALRSIDMKKIRRSPFDTQTLHLGSFCARQYSKLTFIASPIRSGEVVDMPPRNELVYVDGAGGFGLVWKEMINLSKSLKASPFMQVCEHDRFWYMSDNNCDQHLAVYQREWVAFAGTF
jgi:hypothetical protein